MEDMKKDLYDELKEIQVDREEIFDGVIVHLVRDTVVIPNGARATREVCLHHGAVCVVPLTENGEVIMTLANIDPDNAQDIALRIDGGGSLLL